MTTTNGKTAAGATNTSDGNKSIPERSTATAYLSYFPDNTGYTFGTWSTVDLPMKDHVIVIVPMETAQRMYADGPQLVGINTACVKAQSKEYRRQRAEQEAKDRERRLKWITEEVEEEFRDQIADLDDQYTELYKKIDAQAESRFRAGHPEVD